jgi:hypothetical protein
MNRMTRPRTILALFFAAALLAGCTGLRTMHLKSADVVADVDYAIGRGDQRLKGVMDDGLVVPGLPPGKAEREAWTQRLGVDVMARTAPTPKPPAREDFEGATLEYARRYNIAMIRRLSGVRVDAAELQMQGKPPE